MTPQLAEIVERHTLVTALKVALVVGPLLILINQWDALFGNAPFSPWKAGLTLLVPFGVSTWTAISRPS